jgi:hypothetical protein
VHGAIEFEADILGFDLGRINGGAQRSRRPGRENRYTKDCQVKGKLRFQWIFS